jgi:hypothetical protein
VPSTAPDDSVQAEGLLGNLRYLPATHLLGDVGQSLHYIFPGIIARVANKSSRYQLVDDLAGGHSAPEVGYDGFADGSLESFGVIVDFDPHAATKGGKLRHFWREFGARLCGMPGYRETVVQDPALAS